MSDVALLGLILGVAVCLALWSLLVGMHRLLSRNRLAEALAPRRTAAPINLMAELENLWGLKGGDFDRALAEAALCGLGGFSTGTLFLGLFGGIAVGLLAFGFGPRLLAGRRVRGRVKKFRAGLEVALEIMLAALEAGGGLQDAVREAARAAPYPVSEAFGRIREKLEGGVRAKDAFADLAREVPCRETEELRDGIELYESVGGAQALEFLRGVIVTLRKGLTVATQTGQYTRGAKTTGVMVGLAPLGFLAVMMLISPDMVRALVATGRGQVILGVSCVVYLFGAWMVWQIIQGIEEF
ncbi:MAG: hypothetical protein QME76_07135 [Bacillota bacterium]|nr:hypothetical protein [Bacillota bacterium]